MSSDKQTARLLLGFDTCGPSGSVALGRLTSQTVEVLDQIELEGRTYSATLVAAVGELLARHGLSLDKIGCLVAVHGPGSFTGVRVGLSAAKGFAEGAALPVVSISRLEVLARKSGLAAAALDAHRHEVFLRVDGQESLAGLSELGLVQPAPERVAVCDEAAAKLISGAWTSTQLVRVSPPTAADALQAAASRVQSGDFADIALLDGHYLRRSDAEIFGEAAQHP